MDWREHIVIDKEILVGKPVIKGTRLSVEFVLGLFAQGWERKTILENYPNISEQALNAMFEFSLECMSEESRMNSGLRKFDSF